jgi:tetratricopeptide (TPR) repeat protein
MEDKSALKDRVIKLMRENKLEEALAPCTRLCQLAPDDAEAWQTLSTINGKLEHFAEAEACSRRAIAIKPDYADAHSNLGKVFLRLGRLDEALASFRQAIQFDPKFSSAYCNAANILSAQDRDDEALAYYEQALQHNPGNIEARHNLGVALSRLGRIEEASVSYGEVLRLYPTAVETLCNMADGLIILGRFDEANEYYQRALALNPDLIQAHVGRARVLEKQGNYDESYECIKPYLASGVEMPELATLYALLCRRYNRCNEAVELAEKVLARKARQLGRFPRMQLHFALGALYDAAQNYEHAFSHYRQGNEYAADGEFNPQEHVRFVDRIITTFSAERVKNGPRAAMRSDQPVFILGMPRSGTSLVEQILASHPAVYGGGELDTVIKFTKTLPAVLSTVQSYPECVEALTQEKCDLLARDYFERLNTDSMNAVRITDKMPANFLHLGLINMLFPDARVIHCMRDPLDTCLSCYFQQFFAYAYAYTFKLEHLGVYYRQYRRLMKHWHDVLPLQIMDVRYEDLVADQEALSRAMVEFCGLEWDDHCLHFHESDRIINTASYNQVREKIHNKSIARWKHYEPYLGPLKEALKDGTSA